MRRFLACFFVGLGLILISGPVLATDEGADQKKEKILGYQKIARQLVGKPSWSERFLSLMDRQEPKVAVRPFKAEDVPIPLSEATLYLDEFTKSLVREAKGRYGVVARNELGAVVDEMHQIGATERGDNPIGNMFDRARSDLLVVGNLALSGDDIILSFRMVEMETGRMVAAASGKVKRALKQTGQSTKGYSLDGAIAKAARELIRDIRRLDKIAMQGVVFENSGLHTEFGQFFMEKLADGLRKQAASGMRNLNRLEISDFHIEEPVFRGISLQQGASAPKGPSGDFILSGKYWVLDEGIEMRLILSGEAGEVSWRGMINKGAIPSTLALIPAKDKELSEPVTEGPFNLVMTTNKGDNPLFYMGEKMVVSLRSQRDGFAYCFYLQADDTLMQIVPNRFLTRAKLNAGVNRYIPATGMNFDFVMSPPTGIEAVKCFALDRDISEELAQKIGSQAFEPIVGMNERELTRMIRDLPNVRLSEAAVMITLN